VDRTGNVALMLPLDVALLGRVLAELGKATEAANLLHEAEKYHEHLLASDYPYRGTSVFTQTGTPAGCVRYFKLGRSSLLLGRLDEARSLTDRAVELSGRHPGFAARALHLLGDIAIHPDRFDGKSAKVYYQKALALAESREMRPLIAQCHLGLGKVNRLSSRQDQALKHLTVAITMYREMGLTYWWKQVEAELHQLG
jgi:tetratricopeptide (TPR) repeat protein